MLLRCRLELRRGLGLSPYALDFGLGLAVTFRERTPDPA